MMQPLKISCHLRPNTSLAVTNDYLPNLDALLIYACAEQLGLLIPHPNFEQIKKTEKKIAAYMPLAKEYFEGKKTYCVSAPEYTYFEEDKQKFRKKWSNQDIGLDWGKKKAKFSTSEGATKSYDMPLYVRYLQSPINWYVMGEKDKLILLLANIHYLGKKRSFGYGEVDHWDIQEIEKDISIFDGDNLCKVLPSKFLLKSPPPNTQLMVMAWQHPYWYHENFELCYIPLGRVKQHELLPV